MKETIKKTIDYELIIKIMVSENKMLNSKLSAKNRKINK